MAPTGEQGRPPPGGTLLAGGRLVDPAAGVDAPRDLYLHGGAVSRVLDPGAPLPVEHRVLDATGCLVAPGFIDLHSHAVDLAGARLQALDGVTTALELEAGAAGVAELLDRMGDEGRPINFGFAAAWALARMAVLDGEPVRGSFPAFTAAQRLPRWREPARPAELVGVRRALDAELAAGALGVGLLLGYAPDTAPAEYLAIADWAAANGVWATTHTRFISTGPTRNSADGVAEAVRAAAETGAHMHICHLNSSSNRMVEQTTRIVADARAQGLPVTTEAYPYGCGSTVVGAPFLAPEALPDLGLTPADVSLALARTPFTTAADLRAARRDRPGELALFHWLDERRAADRRLLLRSFHLADTAVASDALPLTHQRPDDAGRWPVHPRSFTHPRSAGTFAKAWRLLVREPGGWSPAEAVRRCSALPAQWLAEMCPALARKGTLRPGADADVVVIDLDRLTDEATYAVVRPSSGFRHVLVGGAAVVRDGELLPDARPGRAVRR